MPRDVQRGYIVNTLSKYSYEKFPISFNFIRELKTTGESISTKTITCVNAGTGVSSKSTVVPSESISGAKVVVVIDAGTNGEQHKLTVQITTSGGNSYKKHLILDITRRCDESFSKMPSSEFLIKHDFTEELEDGDTISTVTVTATKTSDDSDATADVIETSVIEDDSIFAGIMGGSAGYDYRISIKIATTLGYKYQKDIMMEVRNAAQV